MSATSTANTRDPYTAVVAVVDVTPSTDTEARLPSTVLSRAWPDLLLLAGIFCVAVAFQWWLRESPWPFDPMFYLNNAGFISGVEGGSQALAVEHRSLRLGVVLPIAVTQKLFGYSEITYYAYPLAIFGLLCTSTYAVARLVLNRVVSTCAAALICFLPFILNWSSHPFPDLASGVWFAVGMVAVLGPSAWGLPDRWRLGLAPVAGVTFGLAYMTKETILVLAPVAVLALYIGRASWAQAGLVVAGSVAVVGAELLLLERYTGDAFARLDVLVGRGFEDEKFSEAHQAKIEQTIAHQGTLLRSLGLFPSKLMRFPGLPFPILGVLLLAPLGAALAWWRTRNRIWWVIGAWAVVFWFFFGLMGRIPTESGRPILRLLNDRYWYPIFIPLVVGALGLVVFAYGAWPRQRPSRARTAVAVGFTVLFVVVVLPVATESRTRVNTYSGHYEEVRRFLQDEGGEYTTLHAVPHTALILRLYTADRFGGDRWDGTLQFTDTALFEDSLVALGAESRIAGAGAGGSTPTSFNQALDGDRSVSLNAPPLDWDVALLTENRRLIVFDPYGSVDDRVLFTTKDPREGLPPIVVPPGTTGLRIRWDFTPTTNGSVGVWCTYSNEAGRQSVPAYTAAQHAWVTEDGLPPPRALLDFFCPAPPGGWENLTVTARGGSGLQAESNTVAVFAEVRNAPSP